ncbi:MAG: helix-turn-helix transcriptional regulator, partial [Verrucomicrobiia bacterium]
NCFGICIGLDKLPPSGKPRSAFGYGVTFDRVFRRCRLSRGLFDQLEIAGENRLRDAPLWTEGACAVLTLCLLEILKRTKGVVLARDRVDTFRTQLWPLLEEISQKPFDPWTVQAMAARCHRSPDHFSKCFSGVFRISPQRYLMENRLRAAAEGLSAEPVASIKQVAATAGYATVHAFTRAFKKVFHTSPGAYRQSFQAR